MILVDTSVWINHLHKQDEQLTNLLIKNQIICHPLVIGELACGNLHQRQKILSLLKALPTIQEVNTLDVLDFIEQQKLMGRGIGIVDITLLFATYIHQIKLWTEDKRLKTVAKTLNLSYIVE
ncbi:PIN domain-containing protein [Candidatus Albibeggiatoa sp. nov. BB20]|uniref:type II toxin-antitoxin system VapC family toxin n=1 Tax=Candidatus Albibeggiatoa sp. nov. BB20 TaxID=3162723 RepID=UPI0033658ADC